MARRPSFAGEAIPYRGFEHAWPSGWRDTKGRALIEVHSIAGMGHGTPIDANAAEGGSAAGPFMLDVGISSTLEIARCWGIAPIAPADEAQAIPSAA